MGGGAGCRSIRGDPVGVNCPDDISLRGEFKFSGGKSSGGAPGAGIGGGALKGGGASICASGATGCMAFNLVPRFTRCCLTSPATSCTSKLSGLALAISSSRKKMGLSPAKSFTCSTWASRLFSSAKGFKFSGLTLLSYTSPQRRGRGLYPPQMWGATCQPRGLAEHFHTLVLILQ